MQVEIKNIWGILSKKVIFQSEKRGKHNTTHTTC